MKRFQKKYQTDCSRQRVNRNETTVEAPNRAGGVNAANARGHRWHCAACDQVIDECHDDYLTTLCQLQWFSEVECSKCMSPAVDACFQVPSRHLQSPWKTIRHVSQNIQWLEIDKTRPEYNKSQDYLCSGVNQEVDGVWDGMA